MAKVANEALDPLPRLRVPNAHAPVLACGSDVLSIAAERQREDLIRMAW